MNEWKILPERLKGTGYVSGIFGKWHLGDHDDTRPHMRGFDESSGLMYSNDMWRFHPMNPRHWGKFPLIFWENGKEKIKDTVKTIPNKPGVYRMLDRNKEIIYVERLKIYSKE